MYTGTIDIGISRRRFRSSAKEIRSAAVPEITIAHDSFDPSFNRNAELAVKECPTVQKVTLKPGFAPRASYFAVHRHAVAKDMRLSGCFAVSTMTILYGLGWMPAVGAGMYLTGYFFSSCIAWLSIKQHSRI